MPLDNGTPGILEDLLPVLESGFVRLLLVPSQLDLANGISAANQIVIADLRGNMNREKRGEQEIMGSLFSYGDVQVDPLHVHLVDDEDEGLVPVGIQVARLDRCLLLLADTLTLKKIGYFVEEVKNEPCVFPRFVFRQRMDGCSSGGGKKRGSPSSRRA